MIRQKLSFFSSQLEGPVANLADRPNLLKGSPTRNEENGCSPYPSRRCAQLARLDCDRRRVCVCVCTHWKYVHGACICLDVLYMNGTAGIL